MARVTFSTCAGYRRCASDCNFKSPRRWSPTGGEAMSKRRLSPAPFPAAKRLHVTGDTNRRSNPLANFDISLYDELVLVIFSHLSWVDLCTVQATNRNWSRLATDNQVHTFLTQDTCEFSRSTICSCGRSSFCANMGGPGFEGPEVSWAERMVGRSNPSPPAL